jgi:hypothetical protein
VWRFIRSAPLTFGWLAVLLVTSLYQHALTRRELHAVLEHQSTNLHHLATDPIRVLLASLLWIDGVWWWPYLLMYCLILVPPNAGWGRCAGWSSACWLTWWLLQAVDTAELAGFHRHSRHDVAREVSSRALAFMRADGTEPSSRLPQLAAAATGGDPTLAPSFAAPHPSIASHTQRGVTDAGRRPHAFGVLDEVLDDYENFVKRVLETKDPQIQGKVERDPRRSALAEAVARAESRVRARRNGR